MGKNAGDTLTLYLDYTVDGEQITEGQFDEIEVSIGSKRYLLTDNEIISWVLWWIDCMCNFNCRIYFRQPII